MDAYQIRRPNDRSQDLGVRGSRIRFKGQPLTGLHQHLYTLADSELSFDGGRAIVSFGRTTSDLDTSQERAALRCADGNRLHRDAYNRVTFSFDPGFGTGSPVEYYDGALRRGEKLFIFLVQLELGHYPSLHIAEP